MSRQLLVFENIFRFPVQAIGIAVNDLQITLVALLSLQTSEIGLCRTLQESGPVLVNLIQAPEQLFRKGYRCLDAHKINIPRTLVCQ